MIKEGERVIKPEQDKELTNEYVFDMRWYLRSDLDKSSMAYKLYELLQTEDGGTANNVAIAGHTGRAKTNCVKQR